MFAKGSGVERVFFPERSGEIPDRPALTFAILASDQVSQDLDETTRTVESMTKERGTSARTFKSALVWCVPDATGAIRSEARKVLAWEDIEYEEDNLRLDDSQRRQLPENLKRARRDLRESVWRAYKNVMLLGKNNSVRLIDLGLVHSSGADSMVTLILNHLRQYDEVQDLISPNFLLRNWPPAFKEWSTRSVRDAFFASPQFPRLLSVEAVKDTISRGVQNGLIAYVGRTTSEEYEPFVFGEDLSVADIEISDDVFILSKEDADSYLKRIEQPPEPTPDPPVDDPNPLDTPPDPEPQPDPDPVPGEVVRTLRWAGEVPAQKWMNFYTKVLTKFAADSDLRLALHVEVTPEGALSEQKIEETKLALRELGLEENVEIIEDGAT